MATESTRVDILDAAEQLFSLQGFAATSVRDITTAAGVNVAAVNYHFGGKEELLRGVTDRVVEPLNERRFMLLDALLNVSEAPTVAQLVEAFVRPDIEALQRLSSRAPHAARYLGRIYSDQTPWIREMTRAQFIEVGRRFVPLFAAALPELSISELEWRIEQMVAAVVHTFATWPEGGMSDQEASSLIHRLTGMFAAALRAPPTKEVEPKTDQR